MNITKMLSLQDSKSYLSVNGKKIPFRRDLENQLNIGLVEREARLKN